MSSTEMDANASCPGDETLAAFVDDRLDPGARLEVVSHLAGCADCRDIVLIASEAAAAEAPNVVRPHFRTGRFIPLVAAAAAILVLLGIPSVRERILPGDPMSALSRMAGEAPERASQARLSIDVAYKPERRIERGAEESSSFSAEQALADAKERAGRTPTAEAFHAVGVACLLNGQRSEAVSALESSVRIAKTPSAAVLNDLSAAYYGTGDYRGALNAADRAWAIEQTPTALWNKAVALKALGRDAEAIAAWNQFRSIEKDAAWDEAAGKEIESLQRLP